MIARHALFALVLALGLTLLAPLQALAASHPAASSAANALAAPQDDGWGAFADWAAAWLNDLFIEGMRAASTLFWFLEKVAAGITRFLTEADLWSTLLNATLGSLRTTMPAVLQNLLFSNNGAGGLVYFALMMAGLLMILPNLQGARLVDASRVVVWAVVVVALFIGSVWGYDLIGLVEQMRAGAVRVVVEAAGERGDLDDLVARPLMADEGALGNYAFVLPDPFEQEYFPEERQYEERHVTFIESPFFVWQMTLAVESEASQEARRDKAQTGLAIAGLTLVPGGVLLGFGVVFATLTAAALVLILFFLVSLPLGFFEFGEAILSGIVRQYAYLWAITLLATILPGLLVAAGTLTYPEAGPPSPAQLMTFIPVLLVVAAATSYVSRMAAAAMTDTFGIVGASIRSSVGSMAYVGSAPAAGGIPGAGTLQGAAGLAATMGLAAATGGVGAALVAGAGTLLASTHAGAGQAAARVAVGVGGGTRSHVFAVAARNRSGLERASHVVTTGTYYRRQEQEAAARQFTTGAGLPSRPTPDTERQMLDAGAFVTTHTRRLDEGEAAFRAGRTVEARRHLASAFGSREVADEVLGVYEQDGEQGMRRVRSVVQTTQATAFEMARTGQPLFDAGVTTPAFRDATWSALRATGTAHPSEAWSASLAGRVAAAAVRPPSGIWADPQAARTLAQATLHPQTSNAEVEDPFAPFHLHDLASAQGWEEPQLEALFESVREGQAAALQGGRPAVEEVARRMTLHGEFARVPEPTRREASRLALLVTQQVQHHRANQEAADTAETIRREPAASPLPMISNPGDPHP